jgi:formylmethanofuran dehydrogenase subunit E
LVITGNEVADGLVEDRFSPILTEKLEMLGSTVLESLVTPDDRTMVADAILTLLAHGADLVITTAGMSVDPDDVTRLAISDAGGCNLVYGAPMLPGAMFLVGNLDGPSGEVPVLGVPACALFFRTTILDAILPRILAGERFSRETIARLSHGGFCLGCTGDCRFPDCGFGRGS